jgi:hypothetical protein
MCNFWYNAKSRTEGPNVTEQHHIEAIEIQTVLFGHSTPEDPRR